MLKKEQSTDIKDFKGVVEKIKANKDMLTSKDIKITNEARNISENKEVNNSMNYTQNSFLNDKAKKNHYVGKSMNASMSKLGNMESQQKKAYKTNVNMKKSNEYQGRNEKIDADKYFKVAEENDTLKKEQLKLNDKFKALQTQLYQMGEKLIKERYLGEKKVIYMDEGTEVEMLNMRNENEKLKEQLRKTKTVIKGMQIEKKVRSTSGPKMLITAKSMNDPTSVNHNEYLKLIKELKVALNDKDQEIKRLHADLYGHGKKGMGSTELYSKDLREKNLELSEIQNKCEKLQLNLETNTKVMKHMEDNLKEYQAMVREEQRKNIELRNENANFQASIDRVPEYLNMIENYKKREKEFEARIQSLCESPFIQQAEERGNIYKKLVESEAALKQQAYEIQKSKQQIIDNEKDLIRLKKECEQLRKDRDQYKEDSIRLKVTTEERDKNTRNFEEQLKLLGQYGEVDSNFTKILTLLKLKDDDNSWMKVEFFDRMGEKNLNDPAFLLKEIEKLVQEKGELGKQLEVTKNVLILQQKISDDLHKEKQELEKITSYQINELKKKCEQLAKRTDIEKRGRGLNKTSLQRDLGVGGLIGDKAYPNDPDTASVADTITEFTKDETESVLGINENALDLYIGEAVLEDGVAGEIGIKLADLMSFCTVDFYLHDIQSSNLSSGKRPWYNLQLKYHVTEDEHLIKYFSGNSSVTIEIHYVKDNVNFILGWGFIPLKQLLDVEGTNNRVINNVCPIYYKNDTNLLIGNVHYKMRMRQSIQESIKWAQDKLKLINEVSPIQHTVNIKAEDNMQTIQDLGKGKVMQVTIMLTKLSNLAVSGPPHEIRPYVWYQFYKSEEHFSKTFKGCNVTLEDINVINSIYDSSFDDYIQNGEIAVMVLDDFRALEVKVKGEDNENQVDLVDNPDVEDFIGLCKIRLKDLVLSDRIQGNFPIINRNGHKAGELGVLIFWEQVSVVGNKLVNVPYEQKAWEEQQVIELAEKLKNKKMNIDSAFEFFNVDNQERLSASNFKLILMTNFRYNSSDVEVLADILFQGNSFMSKLDFNKIFIPLLPGKDQSYNQVHKVELVDNKKTQITVTHKAEDKKLAFVAENTNFEIKDHPKREVVEIIKKENDQNTSNHDMSFKLGQSKGVVKNIQDEMKELKTDRFTKEIMLLIADYMKRTNKNSISELFKVFDKDTNSFISQREVLNGFFNINIPLSQIEINRIWGEMVESSKADKVDLAMFKKFFEKYGIAKKN